MESYKHLNCAYAQLNNVMDEIFQAQASDEDLRNESFDSNTWRAILKIQNYICGVTGQDRD